MSSHNERSRAVMQRLGMRLVATFRLPGLTAMGALTEDADFVKYAISAAAWTE